MAGTLWWKLGGTQWRKSGGPQWRKFGRLQQKVSPVGEVIKGKTTNYSITPNLNNRSNVFSTNLRTMSGFSGAPVVNFLTGKVLGIHTRSEQKTFQYNGGCRRWAQIEKNKRSTTDNRISKLKKVFRYID